jgi:cation:H+ antiporter
VTLDLLYLGAGVILAAAGGELFVRGLVGLAAWARVPAGVIGATVAAFATSSPELTVAVTAAAEGRPEIALGDALGSNLVNIGLVVGLVLLLGVSEATRLSLRDATTALGLALGLLLLLLDGDVSRLDGLVLLIAFSAWIVVTTKAALRGRSDIVETVGERRHGRSIAEALIGLVLLVAAGRSLVAGAQGIGEELGISTFIVGVVLVSLGTSLPELATAIVSRVRGHAELGISTALGSNIFNTAFIVGIAAVAAPIEVAPREAAVSLLAAAAMIPVLVVGSRDKPLRRWRGAVLVGAYAVALLLTLLADRA